MKHFSIFFLPALIVCCLIASGEAQKPGAVDKPAVPRTWDERALADLEVPLADASHSPRHISAEDYYRIPVRPIYKTYPKYHPDKEPPGYRDWLRRQEPVVLWDDGPHRPKLETEADWIKAGELVFNTPVFIGPHTATVEDMRAFIAKTGDLYDNRGISPFTFYVVRNPGRLETGEVSCAECHNRVMPDGTVIKGAQGNRPIEQVTFFGLADNAAKAESKNRFLAEVRQAERSAFAVPWLRPAPDTRLDRFSAAEIEAVHFSIPRGVFARQGTSPFSPAKLPDLIGIKDRRYLDATGLVRQRDIGDLMRYAALNQGCDMLRALRRLHPGRDRRSREIAERARPNRPGSLQRRTALRAGPLHLLAQTAAEPQRLDGSCRPGRAGLRTRRLRDVSHTAALHQ